MTHKTLWDTIPILILIPWRMIEVFTLLLGFVDLETIGSVTVEIFS